MFALLCLMPLSAMGFALSVEPLHTWPRIVWWHASFFVAARASKEMRKRGSAAASLAFFVSVVVLPSVALTTACAQVETRLLYGMASLTHGFRVVGLLTTRYEALDRSTLYRIAYVHFWHDLTHVGAAPIYSDISKRMRIAFRLAFQARHCAAAWQAPGSSMWSTATRLKRYIWAASLTGSSERFLAYCSFQRNDDT